MDSILTKIAEALRVLSPVESRRYFTSAVVLAAGKGERFGQAQGKKQFVPVGGIPAVVRSLQTFEKSELISEVILVTSPTDICRCEEYRDEYGLTKVKKILAGGDDRQASAKIGFDAVDPKSEFIAIHDGARCLITDALLNSTVRAAYKHGAAVAAEQSRDTVKIATMDEFAEMSPDRSTVWLAKTPQVFMTNMYRAAVYMADKDNVRATDDSMLVERLGFKVKMVECGGENLKITVPMDVKIAEAILRAREESDNADRTRI